MKPRLVIISGLSGGGKSVAIKALEDLSYYCIDNLPIDLVESTVKYLLNSSLVGSRIALGMDARSSRFAETFLALLPNLKSLVNTEVVFLRASFAVLSQRFSTTRRRHPMEDVDGSLDAAIARESAAMDAIEQIADFAMDTTELSPHELSRQMENHFSSSQLRRSLHVTISSFGFKYGLLSPSDSVFDVRFLKNPHYDPELKPKNGLNKQVRDYVFSDPNTLSFLEKTVDLHHFLLPCYYKEGKHYYRIGIGCSGGQHRSVAIAEQIALELSELQIPHVHISVKHRDIQL
ncbi:MAG: RNase adapter RapZ [Pseudobacteriovorax sp.]|nr:RNase adapter RapZ [Pseudobacteriovorax sp.]